MLSTKLLHGCLDQFQENFEEWSFEKTSPNQVFLSWLPFHHFYWFQQGYFSLKPEDTQFDGQRKEIRNVGVLAIHPDCYNGYNRPYHEQELSHKLPEIESFSREIFRDRRACHKLYLFSIGKHLEHFRLEIIFGPLASFDVFQRCFDPFYSWLHHRLFLLFGSNVRNGVLLK